MKPFGVQRFGNGVQRFSFAVFVPKAKALHSKKH